MALKLLPIPEGDIFVKWCNARFYKRNQNMLLAITGKTGSGKSYSSMRLAELWYAFRGKKYTTAHIAFDIEELIKILKDGKLEKGDIIILEEAGIALGALDFQNKLAKVTGYVLQSFRSKNIGIIFNLPSLSFLNKTTRVLLHAHYKALGYNPRYKKVELNPKMLDYNGEMDKWYTPHPVVKMGNKTISIHRLFLSKPSEELLVEYEKRKDEFVNKVYDQLMNETSEKGERLNARSKMREKYKVYFTELYHKGVRTVTGMAKELGISQGSASKLGATDVIHALNMQKQDKEGHNA